METKTIITKIEYEDLSDLFSTALIDQGVFSVYYDHEEYERLENKNNEDTLEDCCAKLLLAGKSITVSDMFAESADEDYGTLPHFYDKKGMFMCYEVSLKDIKDGLAKCLNGDFRVIEGYKEQELLYVRTCVNNFIYERENLDITEAEAIIQIIVFGELVYG